jgi:hypothetical protein
MSNFDRYDFALSMLTGVIAVAALLLGAPLWALALIYAIGCTIITVRHVGEDLRER